MSVDDRERGTRATRNTAPHIRTCTIALLRDWGVGARKRLAKKARATCVNLQLRLSLRALVVFYNLTMT